MSHLHVPDGVLPWWLVAAGWAALILTLQVVVRATGRLEQDRRLPRLGFVVAFMVLAMSIEVLPPAYHLDMSVIAGILLGPALGYLAGVAAVILLALVGHGGASVIGLNATIIGTEVALASLAYRGLVAQGVRPPTAAAGAALLALSASTLLTVAVIGLAGLPALQAHDEAHGHDAAIGHGVLTMLALILAAGALGWTLEAALTALLVRYLQRVRPGLLAAA